MASRIYISLRYHIRLYQEEKGIEDSMGLNHIDGLAFNRSNTSNIAALIRILTSSYICSMELIQVTICLKVTID